MKRISISWVVFCATGLYAAVPPKATGATPVAAAAQPVAVDSAAVALAALKAGDIPGAEKLLPEIKNPAAQIYVQACIERAKGDASAAIQTVAKGIVLYYNDQAWVAKSEMLSAALYVELGLLDEADVTAKQVQALYSGTDVVKEADALRSQIEKLKETVKE